MKYPKINTLWKRDPSDKFRIVSGQFSKPEFEAIRKWEATEKVDGTNIRITFRCVPLPYQGKVVEFGGRTDRAQIPAPLVNVLKELFTVEKMGNVFPGEPTVVLFGEGYGDRIQKVGSKYSESTSFILFDVVVDDVWLERSNVVDIAEKLGVRAVPLIGIMNVDEISEYVKGKPRSIIANQDLMMEGVVLRSHPLMLFRNGDPIMWKLKCKDYGG